jgi:hypothetical protein
MSKDNPRTPSSPRAPAFTGGITAANPSGQGLRSTPDFSSLFARPTVQGLYYNGKTVPLDGYRFVGCRFDNCTLLVISTSFELINCVIDPETVIQYGMETIKIIHLFNSRDEAMYTAAPALAPLKNPDGTITISGLPL